jgi:hypothetical protein
VCWLQAELERTQQLLELAKLQLRAALNKK